MAKNYYYDIHVGNALLCEGYSIFLSSAKQLTKKNAIKMAADNAMFSEVGDEFDVSSVTSITQEEYLSATL